MDAKKEAAKGEVISEMVWIMKQAPAGNWNGIVGYSAGFEVGQDVIDHLAWYRKEYPSNKFCLAVITTKKLNY